MQLFLDNITKYRVIVDNFALKDNAETSLLTRLTDFAIENDNITKSLTKPWPLDLQNYTKF